MKRRNFVRSLLVAPAGSAVLAAQQSSSQPSSKAETTGQKPSPPLKTPGRQNSRQPPTDVPKLPVVQSDLASEGDQQFFSPIQFSVLQKLAAVLVPPLKGKPGAVDAQAPEFLDFLIGVSPSDRQELYRRGLDGINSQATEQFHKSFAELEQSQVDAILRPLMVVRPWPEDFPDDPLKNFIARVHEDLKTATTNSREWAHSESGNHLFSRGFSRTSGFYWRPIDPVTEL
jgi:hypothetical protein